MLTDKNPDFESIANALHFLTENRNLVEAYQDYEAREAHNRKRENLIAEQSHIIQQQNLVLQERDARIVELEKMVATKQNSHFSGFLSKWKNLFRKT